RGDRRPAPPHGAPPDRSGGADRPRPRAGAPTLVRPRDQERCRWPCSSPEHMGTKEEPPRGAALEKTGGDLLSQEVALQVPSALRGLTALFGMGRGVSLSLSRHRKGERRPPWSLKTALGRQEAEKKSVKPSTH